MKTSEELISALKSGLVLYKLHPYENYEFLFLDDEIGIKGWGSALGKIGDRLEEIIIHPENWNIVKDFNMKDGYPYPWSTKYVKPIH